MRPKHWIKNGLVLVPVLFAGKLLSLGHFFEALFAFGVFCILSGANYLINDVYDAEADRKHPTKLYRPVANGILAPKKALSAGFAFGAIALLASLALGFKFFLLVLTFYLLNIAYTLWLREIVIVDVFSIAATFVIRVIAGAWAVHVPMSSWLIICTLLLSLFLGLSKRSIELKVLQEVASDHRYTLQEYSGYLLDQMMAVITSAILIAYTLYTMSEQTVEKIGGTALVYTVPFVLYGIFRYLYLIHQRSGEITLERALVNDKPMLINLGFYLLVVVWAIYF